MAEATLFLGNRRYSSWSLRGWLAVRLAGLEVREEVIPLDLEGSKERIAAIAPNAKVPVLAHGGVVVWDSLAILEYVAELEPALWPADRTARAAARSAAAEMHSGFQGLRSSMWMNLGADFSGAGRTEAALADIARIERLWRDLRGRFGQGGPFLFGPVMTGADAFFAPVCARFLSWRPDLSGPAWDYVAAIRAHPLLEEWYDAAAREPSSWLLPKYETKPA